MGRRDKSSRRRIPISVATHLWRRWSTPPHTPQAGAVQRPPPSGQGGSGEGVTSWKRNLMTQSQVIKFNIDLHKIRWSNSTSIFISHADGVYPWHNVMKMALLSLRASSPNPIIPEKFWEEQETNSNRGASYNIPDQHCSKSSRSSSTREVWENVPAKRSPKRHDN